MKNSEKFWKCIKKEYVLDMKWLKIRKEKVELPSGRNIDDFYVVEGGELVAILAIDSDNKVFLVRQYRHAVKDVTIDLPGGGVENGEGPMEAAKRELAEETGMIARNVEKLLTYYPDSGRASTVKHIFVASDFKKNENGFYRQDENENIELITMPFEELLRKTENGELKEATLNIGVFAYINKNLKNR